MFTDDERRIFCYFANGRECRGDPFAITRRLVRWLDGDPDRVLADRWAGYPDVEFDEQGGQLPIDPEAVDKALEPVRFEAEQKIIRAAREAFFLPEYSLETGEGVGEEECLRLFDEFCVWADGQKKSTARPQTYSPLSPDSATSRASRSGTASG